MYVFQLKYFCCSLKIYKKCMLIQINKNEYKIFSFVHKTVNTSLQLCYSYKNINDFMKKKNVFPKTLTSVTDLWSKN